MAGYSIRALADLTGAGGHIVSPDKIITTLITDSRKFYDGGSGVFFAINGPYHDGHQYMEEAYAKGVRHFICERATLAYPDVNQLVVPDALLALQQIAKHHRQQFDFPIAGITGSNGKTIVKEWVFHLLKSQRRICRNPKSYNSQLGVPLSVWQLDSNHNLGLFEAGISQPGEMAVLEGIIQPDVGVFTHLGPAHDNGFTSMQEKVAEKALLFRHCSQLVYCIDTPLVAEAFSSLPTQQHTWTRKDDPHAVWKVAVNGKRLEIRSDAASYSCHIPFTDTAGQDNAITAFVTALALGGDPEVLCAQMEDLPTVHMRLELLKGSGQSILINDVYSADPDSLEIALHFLERQAADNPAQKRIHVVLSDMETRSDNRDAVYERMAGLVHAAGATHFTGIGPELQSRATLFAQLDSRFFLTTEEWLATMDTRRYEHAIILLKGARAFRMERIASRLEWKLHNTVLEVNLTNMVHNLHVYQSMLQEGVRTIVMVKAFGYGSGAAEVAHTLSFQRVDYLAVAYADEGLELRNNGVHIPIMVMNPDPGLVQAMLQAQLEPVIFSFDQMQKCLDAGYRGAVHLKIDTGMHRLGFAPEELPELARRLQEFPAIRVISVFSHLSSADMPEQDAATLQQIAVFRAACTELNNLLPEPFLRHLLNSPGIARFPDAQFDMVRLGIGLYGDDPSSSVQSQLLPVFVFRTTIAQVKTIQAGEAVGYGRSYLAVKPMRIAVLNVGYADGFRRSLSNGKGKVAIHGRTVPVVGRICMDMCMADITDLPEVEPGMEAEIFGHHISLREVAAAMETIPYEVLTGISQRVRRVYLEE